MSACNAGGLVVSFPWRGLFCLPTGFEAIYMDLATLSHAASFCQKANAEPHLVPG